MCACVCVVLNIWRMCSPAQMSLWHFSSSLRRVLLLSWCWSTMQNTTSRHQAETLGRECAWSGWWFTVMQEMWKKKEQGRTVQVWTQPETHFKKSAPTDSIHANLFFKKKNFYPPTGCSSSGARSFFADGQDRSADDCEFKQSSTCRTGVCREESPPNVHEEDVFLKNP